MNRNKGYLKKYLFFIFFSLLAATGNMGVIYIINRIIGDYFTGTSVISKMYLVYFIMFLALFIVCRWVVSFQFIQFTQEFLCRKKESIVNTVLQLSFTSLANHKEKIYSILTREADNIVSASIDMVNILTNAIIVVIGLVYMGFLSGWLLLCMLFLIFITVVIYFASARKTRKYFKTSMSYTDSFVKHLNEILSGFKEIIIEPRKGVDILQTQIKTALSASAVLNRKAHTGFLNNRVVGQVAFYMFVALLVFFLGQLFEIENAVLVNFLFLILYILAPIETIVLLIPNLALARVSIRRLTELEDLSEQNLNYEVAALELLPFDCLELRQISYHYQVTEENSSLASFVVGPLDFEIQKAEAVFLSGGNGSGKTTFVNLLMGILKSDKGDIYVNRQNITSNQSPAYRSLFAPVFSDFHLFDQLYGLSFINNDKANEYLRLFEISDKVTIEKNKFSTKALSTGQRKRLALIGMLLEQKPVIVLDEFAADQDPDFKKKFYTEIIPYLKKEGFTILAITHDDNYFQYADRHYKMDFGRLAEITVNNKFQAEHSFTGL